MPVNHTGVTEGTVGRNINELDFPHLREVEQTYAPKRILGKEVVHLCPCSLTLEHQISKSCLTLPADPWLLSWKLHYQWSLPLLHALGNLSGQAELILL